MDGQHTDRQRALAWPATPTWSAPEPELQRCCCASRAPRRPPRAAATATAAMAALPLERRADESRPCAPGRDRACATFASTHTPLWPGRRWEIGGPAPPACVSRAALPRPAARRELPRARRGGGPARAAPRPQAGERGAGSVVIARQAVTCRGRRAPRRLQRRGHVRARSITWCWRWRRRRGSLGRGAPPRRRFSPSITRYRRRRADLGRPPRLGALLTRGRRPLPPVPGPGGPRGSWPGPARASRSERSTPGARLGRGGSRVYRGPRAGERSGGRVEGTNVVVVLGKGRAVGAGGFVLGPGRAGMPRARCRRPRGVSRPPKRPCRGWGKKLGVQPLCLSLG